ncbi:MAG: AMP-binding protein [Gammaproteobacteria bacterium]|nr:AMP-binding protein [Gammaproteobacteria bacterium]
MNAYELFSHSLQCAEDKVALISGMNKGRTEITYGQLDSHVNRIAKQFLQNGLKAGDRVLLAVPVSVETYAAMLALLKCGMVIMFIEPAHSASQVARILKSWPPVAIVATRSILLLRFLAPELRRIPRRFVVNGRSTGAVELDMHGEDCQRVATQSRSAADSALLSFTSGSTGEPKPVVRTHGFLRQQMRVLNQIANTDPADIDYVAMPMFVLFNLANSVSSIIPACDMKNPGRASPRLVFEQLRSESASRMVASPALLENLGRYCLKNALKLPEMRCVSTGGGPVSPDLPGMLRQVAPQATVRMVYGSTEAEPIACIDDRDISVTAAKKMRAGGGLLVGNPVAGCAVRVIRSQPGASLGPFEKDSFASLVLPAGEIGEIAVAGNHVLAGYADASRNAATKIEVAGRIWHRTGDAGYFDSAGSLWLVGRCTAAISDIRGVVYPFQVEYALAGVAGVRRAALVSRGGKRVLVLEPAGREFRSDCVHAATCIAEHDIDRIVTVRRIPMDKRHSAKIDYPSLETLLEGRLPRFRLALLEVVSSAFRRCRSLYRSLFCYCKFGNSRSKVDEWPLKTR